MFPPSFLMDRENLPLLYKKSANRKRLNWSLPSKKKFRCYYLWSDCNKSTIGRVDSNVSPIAMLLVYMWQLIKQETTPEQTNTCSCLRLRNSMLKTTAFSMSMIRDDSSLYAYRFMPQWMRFDAKSRGINKVNTGSELPDTAWYPDRAVYGFCGLDNCFIFV